MGLTKQRLAINEIDQEMAELFCKRMAIVKEILNYKHAHNLAIFDEKREKEVIKRNSQQLSNPELIEYYISFLQSLMDISKEYQHSLLNKTNE